MTAQESWRDLFGHEEPYTEQVDGIDAAVDVARDSGFLALEGACGTGKTMLALTAGLHLVRDPDSDFERVLVLTSVKQQLRQFEADLRTMNAGLPDDYDPISALTLVGKADVCPYNLAGRAGIDDTNMYERCEGLRDRTRGLTEETTAGALAQRARSQQVGLADSGTDEPGFLAVLDEPTPYPEDTVEDEATETEYCPFYAGYLDGLPDEGDASEAVPFDFTDQGLIEPADLVRLSASRGVCPHSAMGAMLPHMEVVVANYYHAFDPTTVGSFTGPLLDEETFVVCDEAHMLEPRVRDLVSDGVGDATLRDAESELARVLQPLTLEGDGEPAPAGRADARDQIRAELQDADVTTDELARIREFIRDLRSEIDRRVTAHLNREYSGWRASPTDLPDAEIPLRDPEDPAVDDITTWADGEGYADAVWTRAETVGAVAGRILDDLEEDDKQRAAPSVGRLLGAWHRADHTRYFRELQLERTHDDTEPRDSWRRVYNASLALHNCVPGDAIADRLAEFGGGILMSATLAPLPVFERVSGLADLRETADRPVKRRTYGLSFPPENRESFAVATPKFTHDNRGPPGSASETRRVYANALREVARIHGNVLVGMPSYAEAEWAANVLADVEKEVLLDESSADDVTERLKAAFFRGPGKVLVTSLRGTLTEGVDYRGDRLAAAVVCGVPIVNTAAAHTRAVQTAYDREFGDGFETALLVPAVRKARQAVGRVIRGPKEVGVRVLLDERYARDSWDSVRAYLGPERDEFQPVSPDMLSVGLTRFRTESG